MNSVPKQSVILFDGMCNLCSGFVQFIIRNDKHAKFRFASLQSDAAKELLRPYHFTEGELKTLVLLEYAGTVESTAGKIFLRSRAVLRIASQLDGIWKISAVLYVIPKVISDAVYNLVSKYRFRIFGKRDSCMSPTAELISRFL